MSFLLAPFPDIETEALETRKHGSHVVKPGFKPMTLDTQPHFAQADARVPIPG